MQHFFQGGSLSLWDSKATYHPWSPKTFHYFVLINKFETDKEFTTLDDGRSFLESGGPHLVWHSRSLSLTPIIHINIPPSVHPSVLLSVHHPICPSTHLPNLYKNQHSYCRSMKMWMSCVVVSSCWVWCWYLWLFFKAGQGRNNDCRIVPPTPLH